MTYRIVFMGTPEFAVPSLETLAAAGHTVALVVTQPDRPKGRGRLIEPPPVKRLRRTPGTAGHPARIHARRNGAASARRRTRPTSSWSSPSGTSCGKTS